MDALARAVGESCVMPARFHARTDGHRHRVGSLPRLGMAPLILALVATLWGCVSLRPFEEIQHDPEVAEFVVVKGQRVHVEIRGQGEPLVLVHGIGGSTYTWRLVTPQLSRRFRTVAIDLNGFGYTERPTAKEAYSRTGQLDLLTGVMDVLGIDSAHFIGHSYGGGLVLTLAHQRPERVRSIVAVDSATPEWSATGRRKHRFAAPVVPLYVRSLLLQPGHIASALRRSFYNDALVNPDLVESYRERLRVEGVSRTFRNLARPHGESEDLKEVPLEEIHQPILLLWGREDQVIVVDEGRKAAARMARSRFVVLPECGHLPMEEQPAAFLAEVEAFLIPLGD